ncbi:(3R)-3-hydroxyacyl-CoA dehydrogenase-like [Homalodisca vitripennis]|uniref:(3R)-3-hydroxyacyl-CoA dehydrogenase-like n=1 Tax=Homalodisca vitripennis TaxID=197043 RepID=UPI001EE9D0F9|nr:(3R)-3-hydroxyacyl-CoA dehydrogenase-like [Homalodisca vitripennis]
MVKGSLALVTGASSGMGRETCKVLAREGATVVVTCIDEAGANETLKLLPGSGHSVFKYDVTNFQSADELLKAIIQKYNRPPNILVNSAGILAASSTLDMTPEFLQRMLDVNLKVNIANMLIFKTANNKSLTDVGE